MKTLDDIQINGTTVQIKEYLSSEDYFKYLALSPEVSSSAKKEDLSTKTIVASQDAQYHLILSTVINPKLTIEQVKEMDYKLQIKLFLELQKIFLAGEGEGEESVFLGPDAPPDGLQPNQP